jgi:hypothetical protein
MTTKISSVIMSKIRLIIFVIKFKNKLQLIVKLVI